MTNEEIKALFERRMQEEQRRKVENYRQLNALAKPGAILFTGFSFAISSIVSEPTFASKHAASLNLNLPRFC